MKNHSEVVLLGLVVLTVVSFSVDLLWTSRRRRHNRAGDNPVSVMREVGREGNLVVAAALAGPSMLGAAYVGNQGAPVGEFMVPFGLLALSGRNLLAWSDASSCWREGILVGLAVISGTVGLTMA